MISKETNAKLYQAIVGTFKSMIYHNKRPGSTSKHRFADKDMHTIVAHVLNSLWEDDDGKAKPFSWRTITATGQHSGEQYTMISVESRLTKSMQDYCQKHGFLKRWFYLDPCTGMWIDSGYTRPSKGVMLRFKKCTGANQSKYLQASVIIAYNNLDGRLGAEEFEYIGQAEENLYTNIYGSVTPMSAGRQKRKSTAINIKKRNTHNN